MVWTCQIKWVSKYHLYGLTLLFYLVTKPNTKQFVFVRFLVDVAKYTVMGHIDIEIKDNSIYFLPFDQIKGIMEKGEAELI